MTDKFTQEEIDEAFAKAYAYLMRRRHARLARKKQNDQFASPGSEPSMPEETVVLDREESNQS